MTTQAERSRHIALNTLLVGASFGLAAVTGLLRNIIIAQQFGIGIELDAYYAAFRLPDLIFTVLAGGALATAFIPVFAGFLADDERDGAWRLASAITNIIAIVVGVVALMAALLAPRLVEAIIAPGFDAAQQAETVAAMRLVLISTVIFSVSSVQTSILHGFKHFLLPALAPVVYPLGIIIGALLWAPQWGVAGLALGAVLGSVFNLSIKIPGLIRYGFRWLPVFDLRSPAVQRVFVLMAPRILDLAVFQITLLITTNLASRLQGGSVSALEWGWDAMQLPETVIGTAFGLVAFPTLAELAARHDIPGLRATLDETLRAVLTLAIPAAVALILLGRPMLAALYQRGSFDADSTEAVYVALQFFAIGLVGHASLELIARAFFAQLDTITPLFVAMGSAVTNILLGIVLMQVLGHGGLALANSIAITGEVLVLLWLLRKRWGSVGGRSLLATVARVSVASVAMAIAILAVLQIAARQSMGSMTMLLFSVIAGGGVYIVVAVLLREPGLRFFPAALASLRR